jgi:hypothetical protein
MKHTAGPWVDDRKWITDHNGNTIAEVSYEQDGHVRANAALIAAAPDLLEALKGTLALAMAYYRTLPDDGPAQDHYMTSIIEPAGRAIAKAMGESL